MARRIEQHRLDLFPQTIAFEIVESCRALPDAAITVEAARVEVDPFQRLGDRAGPVAAVFGPEGMGANRCYVLVRCAVAFGKELGNAPLQAFLLATIGEVVLIEDAKCGFAPRPCIFAIALQASEED